MSKKEMILAVLTLSLFCSCEHFITYEEYIVNHTNDDIIIYIQEENHNYNQLISDSLMLKKGERIKLLRYREMNGYELQFEQCSFMDIYLPLDSLFVAKKANDTLKSFRLNDRSKWYYEKVDQQFKNKDCECVYHIGEADF